jgi:hypothetical protein
MSEALSPDPRHDVLLERGFEGRCVLVAPALLELRVGTRHRLGGSRDHRLLAITLSASIHLASSELAEVRRPLTRLTKRQVRRIGPRPMSGRLPPCCPPRPSSCPRRLYAQVQARTVTMHARLGAAHVQIRQFSRQPFGRSHISAYTVFQICAPVNARRRTGPGQRMAGSCVFTEWRTVAHWS